MTGETAAASENAAAQLGSLLLKKTFRNLEILIEFIEDTGSTSLATNHPSAFCAMEIALLDLFARKQGLPLWRVFTEQPCVDSLTYSAVLPLLDKGQRAKFLALTKKLGLFHIKAKVSDRGQALQLAMEIFDLLGPSTDLRLDANGAFSWQEAVDTLAALRDRGIRISAFEQPVSKDDLEGLKKVEAHSAVPVIADESACSMTDMERIISQGLCSGLSIRLSKCGGLLKCIKAVNMAKVSGLFCQLGCHVGETSILAAAGRHLAAICGPFRYTEGSYSRFVLERDITETPCEFSFHGQASIPDGPGLGIDISMQLLHSCSELISDTGAC